MTSKLERFNKESKYLANVPARTLERHTQSLEWLDIEDPSERDFKACVMRMKEAGLKASSVNCSPHHQCIFEVDRFIIEVPKLKEEKKMMPTFNAEEVKTLTQWNLQSWVKQR